MPRFRVLRRVDAFVEYVAEIEANSPEEAARNADVGEELYDWQKREVVQFDARMYVALDDQGGEVESTQRGDF